jgi:DnaJ-class molecular chaperone
MQELQARIAIGRATMDEARAADTTRPAGTVWTEQYGDRTYTLRRLRCFECRGRGTMGLLHKTPCHYCGGTGGLNDIVSTLPA